MRKILIASSVAMYLGWLPLAQAATLCGEMLMPAAQLKQVSRGVGNGHTGLDLMAPYGSPVRAAFAGTVIFAGRYYDYGNMIDIRHPDGMMTRYAHLSSFAATIRPGAPVETGTVIGAIGTSGRAHGAHLHFEVRIDGRVMDPKPYLGLAVCQTPIGPSRTPIEQAQAPLRLPPATTPHDVRPK